MSLFASVSIAEIKARGSIKDADVVRLRKNFAEASSVSLAEIDLLRSLNDACPIQDPAWTGCFVDIVTDFIVAEAEPEGYMNAQKCALLRSWIAPAGLVETKAKLDLLINVIASSRWAPLSLVVFGLEQVYQAVLTNSGPLRAGRVFEPRTVTEGDVAVLRQILQSFTTEGLEGVTREEAGVLLDIDRATATSINHPAWGQLVAAAVGSAVLAASGYAAPPRFQSLSRAGWQTLDPDLDDILAGRQAPVSSVLREFRALSREERAILRLSQQKVGIVTREDLPAYDTAWFADYLAAPANRTPNVLALLKLFKRDGIRLDARLQAFVDQIPLAA